MSVSEGARGPQLSGSGLVSGRLSPAQTWPPQGNPGCCPCFPSGVSLLLLQTYWVFLYPTLPTFSLTLTSLLLSFSILQYGIVLTIMTAFVKLFSLPRRRQKNVLKKKKKRANPIEKTNEGTVHSPWVKVSKIKPPLELGLEGWVGLCEAQKWQKGFQRRKCLHKSMGNSRNFWLCYGA